VRSPGPGSRRWQEQEGRHGDGDWAVYSAGPMAGAALAALVLPASSLREPRPGSVETVVFATAQAQMP
jgi:hypothetical protein